MLNVNLALVRATTNREGKERDGRQRKPETTVVAAKTVAFVIDGGNHALSVPAHGEEFIAKVEAFVSGLVD